MDPPYNKGLWRPVLERLKRLDLVAPGGIVILEESVEAEVEPRGWDVLADKTWGAARVLFLRVGDEV
jgi:16S rRNA (guanine966-N2)-methyltransferase